MFFCLNCNFEENTRTSGFCKGSRSGPTRGRDPCPPCVFHFSHKKGNLRKKWKKRVFEKRYWYRDGSDDFWPLRALSFQTLEKVNAASDLVWARFYERGIGHLSVTAFVTFGVMSGSSLILAYLGVPRFSGISKWANKNEKSCFFGALEKKAELCFAISKNVVFWWPKRMIFKIWMSFRGCKCSNFGVKSRKALVYGGLKALRLLEKWCFSEFLPYACVFFMFQSANRFISEGAPFRFLGL